MSKKENNTGKKSKVKFFYLGFVVILLVLMVVFLMYCNRCLKEYEASQPYYVMDDAIAAISANGIAALDTSSLTFNELETSDHFFSLLQAKIQAGPLSYEKLREDYTTGALIYGVYAGDSEIAEASVLPGDSHQVMYILTVTNWSLGQVTALQPETDTLNLTITMPDNYMATVNDIPLDDSYITGTVSDNSLSYCQEYVDVPDFVTYEVTGLTYEPNITIKNESGIIIDYADYLDVTYDSEDSADSSTNASENNAGSSTDTTNADIDSSDMPDTEPLPSQITIRLPFASRELAETGEDQELREMILEGVERYSNFFSKDLPGCKESIDPIRDLFPEDSIYLSLADQYRREDMGVFSSHSNTHFLNEEITEYTEYSSECFSCHVHFDKSMSLGGREMIDTTDNTYYYVKINGKWKIADIQ